MKGKQIKTLAQLGKAASERRAVILHPGSTRRTPAAVILNHQAWLVLKMLEKGMWIYKGKTRVDLTKPPRKWTPYKPQKTQ